MGVEARLLLPRVNVSGNLLWRPADVLGRSSELATSLAELKSLGYWASSFPSADGITFSWESIESIRADDDIVADIRASFPWLNVMLAETRDANWEAASLLGDERHMCEVMVPITKVLIEDTFELGGFRFVCEKQFDKEPFERLATFDTAYVQFQAELSAKHLLGAKGGVDINDELIRRCLALAEHAMDLVRHEHGSFVRPEFTPNPAGLMADGFYAVEILPSGGIAVEELSLAGIVSPLSTSNNYLGPEVPNYFSADTLAVADALSTRDDELEKSVRTALRACRQSFYTLGDESRFLNLVFALDGLAAVDKNLRGWQQRTYISALVSKGDPARYNKMLDRYNTLYADVRNKLVHGGREFYELSSEPRESCEFCIRASRPSLVRSSHCP